MADDGFTHMDLRDAQGECGRRDDFVFDQCGKCGMRVGLHCSDCKIQVTGCFCTEIERFGNDEALKRMIERIGEEEAYVRARKLGIWTPDNHR